MASCRFCSQEVDSFYGKFGRMRFCRAHYVQVRRFQAKYKGFCCCCREQINVGDYVRGLKVEGYWHIWCECCNAYRTEEEVRQEEEQRARWSYERRERERERQQYSDFFNSGFGADKQRYLLVFGLEVLPPVLKELEVQYKKLARQHHPDLGGDLEKMKEVNAAFDYLKALY